MNLRIFTYPRSNNKIVVRGIISLLVLGLAAFLGSRPSIIWLALPVLLVGGGLLVQQPLLGLLASIPVALIVPLEIKTGTAVNINPVTLLVPTLIGLWVLDMIRRRDFSITESPTNRPLLLFLGAGLLSFLIGNCLWDPFVPRSSNFAIVQLAQWAIFVFSGGAFWLTGNMVRDEIWLRRLTFLFLFVAGSQAILVAVTNGANLVNFGLATFAIARPTFWFLLAALGGGQLLFNEELSTEWRLFLLIVLGSIMFYVFKLAKDAASNWVSVTTAVIVLAWLRWSQLRWLALVAILALAATGFLSAFIYDFAGGDDEWEESGASRLVLIGRVIEVTMRNPITGLGPAAYRNYAAMKPLRYGKAYWIEPKINSHNNYVDLFAHVGLLGLGLFLWFSGEIVLLGWRLHLCLNHGFASGYVNAILAAWAASLVSMLFIDLILPFVYNVGFPGFQASVLVWLFLGGLVAIENFKRIEDHSEANHAPPT